MSIRKLALIAGSVAMIGCLGLGLSATAGADTGYPGTTTVTTDPGGSNPSGPTDPCVISPTSCTPAGTHTPSASGPFGGSSGSGGSSGTLAFTGADLLALIIGALFLLAAGTLLVIFTRRRASHQHI
jgi:hypothetical protein